MQTAGGRLPASLSLDGMGRVVPNILTLRTPWLHEEAPSSSVGLPVEGLA
jgi:hypothetical protein